MSEQWNPLVVHFGRMGDMVTLLAMIRTLRIRFGLPVDLVSESWIQPLMQGQPDIRTLYMIPSRKAPYWASVAQRRLVEALKRRGPTPTWICDDPNVTESRGLIARAGIPQELIVDASTCPIGKREHVVDFWVRFSRLTPAVLHHVAHIQDQQAASVSVRVPPLSVAGAWRTELDTWLARRGLLSKPLILVQAGSRKATRLGRRSFRASNNKYWTDESWARVIDEVAMAEPHAHILLAGVQAEVGLNEDILRLVRTQRAHNVAAELPMQRLLALQERAIGMISADTGPAHSAAALGCPLVVLFGAADPAVWEPRSPTGVVRSLVGEVNGQRSMLGIKPEEVVLAWTHVQRQQQAIKAGSVTLRHQA